MRFFEEIMPTTTQVPYQGVGRARPDPPDKDNGTVRHTPILILGAGPAGLALASELKRRELPFLILEKGTGVAESWRNMPRSLKLVSPWHTNSLPESEKNLFPAFHQTSREEYFNYLQAYAASGEFPVQTNCEVQSVAKPGQGLFRVQTSRGDFSSEIVINATGYFSSPFLPPIPGAGESQLPQLHFAGYRDPQQLESLIDSVGAKGQLTGRTGIRPTNARFVLIVGKRLSAGQIMVELAQAGFTVALSHRSPITFGAEPLAWWFLFRLFPCLEWLKLRLNGNRARPNDVRMQGGSARKLIQSGAVKTFPSIDHMEDTSVVFSDGQKIRPDLVLYATGFRPALQHLAALDLLIDAETGRPELRELESVRVPGLYFLGLDGGRNFQSRFIRGIRKDAAFLAEQLAEKLVLA